MIDSFLQDELTVNKRQVEQSQAAVRKAKRFYGSWAGLGAVLDPPLSRQGAFRFSRETIPVNRAIQIEIGCDGYVTREELRPDIDWGRG